MSFIIYNNIEISFVLSRKFLLAKMATHPTPEELQNAYMRHVQRQENQRKYQKKYMEKKKKNVEELQKELDEMKQKNNVLMFYYNLFYLFQQNNPGPLEDFITSLSYQNLQPPEFHDAIQRLRPKLGGGAQTTVRPKNISPDASPDPFVTPAIGPFVDLERV